jgi:hypothetical protein
MSTRVLTTIDRVKAFAQITTTNYDGYIDLLIPIVLEDINHYTNNYFTQSWRYFTSNDFDFSTALTITDNSAGNDFNDELQAGDTILVYNSQFNDDYYTIASLTSTVLTVNESLNAESTSNNVIAIYRVEFPKNLEFIAANMLNYQILTSAGKKIYESESLGDYSYTLAKGTGNTGLSNSYPDSIIKSLNKYRVMNKK